MFRLGEKTYKLVRIGLVRAACPREVEHSRDNLNWGNAIRIDANVQRYGRVARVGFVPAGIIVAGAARRLKMLEGGFVYDYAFVDRAVTDFRCADEISANELMQKLDAALRERILGSLAQDGGCCAPGVISPYIMEIYPFENFFIYNLKGQKYRQGYVIDPINRVVRLGVGSQKVEEKFVDAGKEVKAGGPGSGRHASGIPAQQGLHDKLVRAGWTNTRNVKRTGDSIYKHPTKGEITVRTDGWWDHRTKQHAAGGYVGTTTPMDRYASPQLPHMAFAGIAASVDKMPLVQTGVRYSPAVAPANNQTMTRGASNSELVTMIVRNWKNVLEAVEMYLEAIRNGQQKPPFRLPAFAPVNLTPAGKIGQTVAAAGVDVYDFAMWSAKKQQELATGGTKAQAKLVAA